jgi:hypothetical protein
MGHLYLLFSKEGEQALTALSFCIPDNSLVACSYASWYSCVLRVSDTFLSDAPFTGSFFNFSYLSESFGFVLAQKPRVPSNFVNAWFGKGSWTPPNCGMTSATLTKGNNEFSWPHPASVVV